jgi:hypothetical protein
LPIRTERGLPDKQINFLELNKAFLRPGFIPKIRPSTTKTQLLREEISRMKRLESSNSFLQWSKRGDIGSRINDRNLNGVTYPPFGGCNNRIMSEKTIGTKNNRPNVKTPLYRTKTQFSNTFSSKQIFKQNKKKKKQDLV